MTAPSNQAPWVAVEDSLRRHIRWLSDALTSKDTVKRDRSIRILASHIYRHSVPVSFGIGTSVRISGDQEHTVRFVTNVALSSARILYELDYAPGFKERDELIFVAHATPEALKQLSERFRLAMNLDDFAEFE